METEYVVWGVPPGGDGEQPLYTLARTMADARRVAGVLEREHGCTLLRVQVLNLSEPPDFVRAVLAPSVKTRTPRR